MLESLGIFASKLNDLELNSNGFKMIIGMVISCVVTYIATKWFRNIVVNGKIIYFSYYCLAVGVFALIIL